MSSDEVLQEPAPQQDEPVQSPTEPAATKKRPRLDLSEPRERKRGKSMFGILLGTLNKAKIEDKERNASEAAKKRQLIEQRLQHKLRKETDSVRRAEEAKKDKTAANRKEEELQLKDSVYKLRRTRFALLANFLLTSDTIPSSSSDEDDPSPLPLPLSQPPRTHPPPLYYLPAILTPAQESFINRRKTQVVEAAEQEYAAFLEERAKGVEEILELRRRVAEEEERKRSERSPDADLTGTSMPVDKTEASGAEMDVDKESREDKEKDEKEQEEKEEKKDEMQADDDDAVEY